MSLHNTDPAVAVQLGIVGLALLSGLGLLLLVDAGGAVRRRLLGIDIVTFLNVCQVYGAVWELFSFRALHQDLRACWALLGGAALSFALYPKVAAGDREQ